MPSDFSYLPPASHALQFIVFYQQFTITMYFSPLLISLPYSSVRVTSRDGNSLIFTKTFYIMLRFSGQFSTARHSQAQFSNTYKVRPICIVYSKQPFVLLAKVQFTYTVRSIQFTHSSPIVHLHSSLTQFAHTQSEYRLNL